MEKIWLNNYPKNVKHTVDIHLFSSLSDLFLKSAEQFSTLPAVECLGVTLTYQELKIKVETFAAYLQSQGFKKGDRLAIMLPNCIQYMITLFGAFLAGLTVVNINPLYSERELHHQLQDSGATSIVVLANVAHTLAKVAPELNLSHIIVTQMGDLHPWPKSTMINFIIRRIKKTVPPYQFKHVINFANIIKKKNNKAFKPVELTHQDIAFLQYTGGTTGIAKGAVLTHGNMVANVEQAYAWLEGHLLVGKERVGVLLPLYHVFSLLTNAFIFTRIGSLNVLIPNPRDTKMVIKAFKKNRFTVLMVVNTLLNNLLSKEEFRKLDFSGLHVVIAGGMALQKAIAERWKDVTGIAVCEGFGLTEASPIVSVSPIDQQDYKGSIGLPIPMTDIKIINEAEEELPLGEGGELCIAGPQVMQAYWNNPDETKKVLTADGWLKTGDIARLDEEGFIYIVDRKKDMIDVAGFNVYPNEIENVLVQHPQVSEAAVVGVPHRVTGEALKAYVVRNDDALTKGELMAYCRQHMVSYKVPRRIEFCKELPKNNVGKVLRRLLREQATEMIS